MVHSIRSSAKAKTWNKSVTSLIALEQMIFWKNNDTIIISVFKIDITKCFYFSKDVICSKHMSDVILWFHVFIMADAHHINPTLCPVKTKKIVQLLLLLMPEGFNHENLKDKKKVCGKTVKAALFFWSVCGMTYYLRKVTYTIWHLLTVSFGQDQKLFHNFVLIS